jgi:hypothetical protein
MLGEQPLTLYDIGEPDKKHFIIEINSRQKSQKGLKIMARKSSQHEFDEKKKYNQCSERKKVAKRRK